MKQLMLPSFIHLYDEGTAETLDVEAMGSYIQGNLPSNVIVDVRGEFFGWHLAQLPEAKRKETIDSLAKQLASIKVRSPDSPELSADPIYGEIEYERRGLKSATPKPTGILYDGFRLSSILYSLILEKEVRFDHIHIVFTHQLFGTWGEGDLRYHARVNVCGFPSVISTTGVVEAPAKPRDFYLLKQQYSTVGMSYASLVDLKQQFQGRFIDYDDPKLTEVMKGYAMQAIFYHLTGDAF